MEVKDVYILSAVRTPITMFRGTFARLSAMDLGTIVCTEALKRADVDPESVDETIVGCVLTAGLGQNIARQIALRTGMPKRTQCVTINKVCSSSMKAIVSGAQGIQLGYRNIVVAVGTESMSNAPFCLSRGDHIMGNVQLVDSLQRDGLTDAILDQSMGLCAEKTIKEFGITREELDASALDSYNLANISWSTGRFSEEVVPVTVPQRKGEPIVVKEDEGYKRLIPSKVPTLRPAFLNDGSGTITAANASSISDGAAAIVLGSKQMIRAGKRPFGQILAYAEAGIDPVDFTKAPAHAVRELLAVAGVSKDSISLWEINEAFAVTRMVFIKELGLNPNLVNIGGGAVALGHPIGASGARIVVTLIHALERDQLGVAAICNGGGEAMAVLIKRLA